MFSAPLTMPPSGLLSFNLQGVFLLTNSFAAWFVDSCSLLDLPSGQKDPSCDLSQHLLTSNRARVAVT